MARYVVGKVSEFGPGSRKIVSVAGRSIGIFRVGEELFAVRNQCPHAGAPLCEGHLGGIASSSEPGHYEYTRPGEFIRCPWHSWEFDLRTGQSRIDPARVRVRAYQTRIVSGCALQEQNEAEAPPPAVETYPVTVDENYVQIEI